MGSQRCFGSIGVGSGPARKSILVWRTSTQVCPGCSYTLVERTTYCPYCGVQLTYPLWKKIGASILLILIVYGLVQCHLRMLEGLNEF